MHQNYGLYCILSFQWQTQWIQNIHMHVHVHNKQTYFIINWYMDLDARAREHTHMLTLTCNYMHKFDDRKTKQKEIKRWITNNKIKSNKT